MGEDHQNPEELSDTVWERIRIPHDWMIVDTKALYRDSIGWYRNRFVFHPALDRQYLLRFDGVYMDSTIFVNGRIAGEWKYGYTCFEVDLTNELTDGENEILVRVVYRNPNTRWYSGAGIFRSVRLKERKKEAHFVSDGIRICAFRKDTTKPFCVTDTWNVDLHMECEVLKDTEETKDLTLRARILTLDGKEVCVPGQTAVSGDGESFLSAEITAPKLWDIGEGNLYVAEVSLYGGEVCLETEQVRFGFREVTYTTDEGMFLNGRHVKIHGVCEHHDLGALGAAFSKEVLRRKFEKLTEMGVNAIRTSHNIPATEFMDLADEMGIMVDSECFDMWFSSKTTYDYGRFFDEWAERDVERWIRRDRNHPSVIMWSVGNEIPDTLNAKKGPDTAHRLYDTVRRFDPEPHAQAAITIGANFNMYEPGQKCSDVMDLAGYNYSEYLYADHHKQFPDWVIYGSETSSVLSSRNIYHFPKEKHIITEEDEQCSSLGNTVTGWCAESYEAVICDDENTPFSLGQFLWTGFDYIGESTPYDTKNSYYGQIDLAGFPKDSFYAFQAAWTDYRKKPMIHIAPYWDFNEGQIIDVTVYSNAPWVELFLNGESLGKKQGYAYAFKEKVKGQERPHRENFAGWQIAYRPGVLLAKAYDENGTEIASDKKESFTDATKMSFLSEPKRYGEFLFMEVAAVDEKGRIVENANNRVFVSAEGALCIEAIDNGDSADFEQYRTDAKKLFGGRLLVILRILSGGDAKVTLSSKGLEDLEYTGSFEGDPVQVESAIRKVIKAQSFVTGGSGYKVLDRKEAMEEVPVRKALLTMREEGDSKIVEAHLYPEGATYDTLEWQLTSATGIPMEDAVLTVGDDQKSVRIKGLQDCDGYLRCLCRNGGGNAQVISYQNISFKGLGKKPRDPYRAILFGTYDVRRGRLEEGIQHGMNFLGSGWGGKMGLVGFKDVDFTDEGAVGFKVSIFANTGGNPVWFSLYEGDPEEGGRLIGTYRYQKSPQWMVFQEEEYTLEEKIKGRKDIYIRTEDGFQFKEICFVK